MKKLINLILSVLCLLIIINCEPPAVDPPVSVTGEVKYVVECFPSGFNITYENSTGNTQQEDIINHAWEYTFTGHRDQFVYISAQAENEDATISAKIYYKGNLIEEATSNGDYVIATASGSLP
jgi:hypothetical protein